MDGKSEKDGLRDFTVNDVTERCPICLGVMSQDNLAMPDSCCHIFCLGCILTWAESQTSPSCPVDRQSFNAIYKWDTSLGLILVHVMKKTGALEPERSQQKELQMTLRTPTKERIHINKCEDKDPSAIIRKKVQQPLHFTWSLSTSGTAPGILIQGISEPLWVVEEELSVPGWKQCRQQTENLPWLLAAVPVSAWGNSRHWLNATGWRNTQFLLGSFSPFKISTTQSGFGQFVFQGRGYAVTCPKGGEKKGGQTSSARSPFRQTESMTSRCSHHTSKAQEQAPLQDSASLQSQSSDSDLSANMSPQPGQDPVASSQSEGKKTGHGRRKATPRLLNRLTAGEEDDGVDKEIEKNKQGKEESPDAESTPLQWNQNSSLVNEELCSKSSLSNFILEQGEIMSQVDEDSSSDEQLLVKETESEETKGSLNDQGVSSEASLNGKGMSSDWNKAQDHKKTFFSGQIDLSLHSSNVVPFEIPKFLHSGKHLEEVQDDNAYPVGAVSDSVEKNLKKDISNAVNAEIVLSAIKEQGPHDESQFSDSLVGTKPLKAQATSENKAFEYASIHSLRHWTNEIHKTTTKMDMDQSKDDTNIVPMDCDSQSSEHNNHLTINPQIESSIMNAEVLAPTSLSLLDNNGRQQQQEGLSEMESQDKSSGRQRQSRFHSATTTWSPQRDSRQNSSRASSSGSREHTRERDGNLPSSYSTHIRSWDRGGDNKKETSKKECNYEEKSRRRSRSKSISRTRSRSNSRSRSATRPYKRGTSPEQPTSGAQLPSWKTDRWIGERWRTDHRSDGDESRFKNDSYGDLSPDHGCLTNPVWVQEKTTGDAGARSHKTLSVDENNRWDDQANSGLADSRSRFGIPSGCGGSEHRSPGQVGYRMCNLPEEQVENQDSRQSRNNFSGTAKNSGSDAYSRFNENRGRRKEIDVGELPLDRSGWSSASSWAVRRTLPADVQSYYSRRERGCGGGGRIRREEDQPTKDLPKDDLTLQTQSESQASLGVMHTQFNVLHYPLGQHGVPVNLQSAAPYGMPPQVPIHLHPTVPLLQVPCMTAQSLPPPPPPPPPMPHGSLTAAQPDSRTTQKLQIQERAVNEVKTAIKPYYQKKDITKEEYKEIVRKAVEKVCHSKSGEVNSGKVANLVKAYVDKYKHVRKK